MVAPMLSRCAACPHTFPDPRHCLEHPRARILGRRTHSARGRKPPVDLLTCTRMSILSASVAGDEAGDHQSHQGGRADTAGTRLEPIGVRPARPPAALLTSRLCGAWQVESATPPCSMRAWRSTSCDGILLNHPQARPTHLVSACLRLAQNIYTSQKRCMFYTLSSRGFPFSLCFARKYCEGCD